MSAPGFWRNARQQYWSGQAVGLPFAGNTYYVGDGAPPGVGIRRVDTIAAALGLLIPRDVLILGPQGFEEGNLVLPASATGVTIIGAGPRGSCFIEAPNAGDEGLQILADDVSLINVGVASGATGDYSLKVGSQTVSPARFRAYGCKFEGNEGANPAGQVVLQGCGDIILEDCELCWGVNGIIGDSNNDGFPTQVLVRNCWFHDLTTVHIGVGAAEHFVELWLRDNYFDRDEAGAVPTDFILLSDNANTGVITGNRFANATNEAAVITIGTGLIYMANATEAGWSTARPA